MKCLLRPINPERICLVVPSNVANDVTFLVNTTSLKSPQDWKCDDMGAWCNNGVQRSQFYHDYGAVKEMKDGMAPYKATTYNPVRYYYKNKSSNDVKKFVSYLEGKYFTIEWIELLMCIIMLKDLTKCRHYYKHNPKSKHLRPEKEFIFDDCLEMVWVDKRPSRPS